MPQKFAEQVIGVFTRLSFSLTSNALVLQPLWLDLVRFDLVVADQSQTRKRWRPSAESLFLSEGDCDQINEIEGKIKSGHLRFCVDF